MYFLEKALEFIFLPSCGVCGKLGEGYLCKKCERELEKYVIAPAERYAVQKRKFDAKIIENNLESIGKISDKKRNTQEVNDGSASEKIEKLHVFAYKDLVRNLIISYKFNDKSYLYKTFCEFMVKNKKVFDFIKSYDIIIPVPMHKSKIRKRGYNQSELIAKELARKSAIKIETEVLIKIKNNKVQSTLSKKEREENTKNVYKIKKKEKIKNKKILILDDIYTTGATVNACVQELKKAKVAKIGILTLARD